MSKGPGYTRGFTLMELLLVVVLLGVLAGVVFPRLKGSVRAAGLDEAAARLAEVTRFARVEGGRRGVKVRLKVSADGASYDVAIQNGGESDGSDCAEFGEPILDARHALRQGIRITRVRQGDVVVDRGVIVFGAEGTGEPCTFELADSEGRTVYVEIGERMDQVSVSKLKEEP